MTSMPPPDYYVGDLPGEVWMPVPDYQESYQVSNQGRVKSLPRPGYRHRRPRMLRLNPAHGGYRSVCLYRNAKQRRVAVHRLVLTAFIGPCPEGHVACHRDGNPANNVVSNLYWGTPSENQLDNVRLGTHAEARKTSCRNGHPFTAENIYRREASPGTRYCVTCRKIWERERYAKARKA